MFKKYLVATAISLSAIGIPEVVLAQTEISVEERLQNLELRIENQASLLTAMQAEINKVAKQNLALKQSLYLVPTIAEYKTEEFLYKVHKVEGDSATGIVTVDMTITNTTDEDIEKLQFERIIFMDENGVQNPAFKNYEATIGDNNSAMSLNTIYIDSPTKLTISLQEFPTSSQYVKILDGKVFKASGFNSVPRSFVMHNLTINWK